MDLAELLKFWKHLISIYYHSSRGTLQGKREGQRSKLSLKSSDGARAVEAGRAIMGRELGKEVLVGMLQHYLQAQKPRSANSTGRTPSAKPLELLSPVHPGPQASSTWVPLPLLARGSHCLMTRSPPATSCSCLLSAETGHCRLNRLPLGLQCSSSCLGNSLWDIKIDWITKSYTCKWYVRWHHFLFDC